jgi:hypothetical protein
LSGFLQDWPESVSGRVQIESMKKLTAIIHQGGLMKAVFGRLAWGPMVKARPSMNACATLERPFTFC